MNFKDISDILGKFEQDNTESKSIKSKEEVLAERKLNCEQLCEITNNRVGNLNEKDGYDCPKCLNRGYFVKPHLYNNFYIEIFVECKCKKTRNALRRLKDSGLEYVVNKYRFDNFEVTEDWQKEMLFTAKKFVEDYSGKWFFIGGSNGCGKTHLCTASAITLLKKNNEVRYMLWRDEASRLKSLLNSEEYLNEIEYYKNVDVLYIDDLFKTGKSENQQTQRPTSADINLAFEILNNRAMKNKTTIISTECIIEELIDIDRAIAGRIKQMCGEQYCLSIDRDKNKDYRLKER